MGQFSGQTGQMGSRRPSLPREAFLQVGPLTPGPGRGFLRWRSIWWATYHGRWGVRNEQTEAWRAVVSWGPGGRAPSPIHNSPRAPGFWVFLDHTRLPYPSIPPRLQPHGERLVIFSGVTVAILPFTVHWPRVSHHLKHPACIAYFILPIAL